MIFAHIITLKPLGTHKPPQEPISHARPALVQGSIQADTVGKTVGSFFEMMGSLFEYLDDNSD